MLFNGSSSQRLVVVLLACTLSSENVCGVNIVRGLCDCHTLKYLILGCEYLLKCINPSLGFPKNFPDFSGNYSHFLVS
jgi:hypothetical protein